MKKSLIEDNVKLNTKEKNEILDNINPNLVKEYTDNLFSEVKAQLQNQEKVEFTIGSDAETKVKNYTLKDGTLLKVEETIKPEGNINTRATGTAPEGKCSYECKIYVQNNLILPDTYVVLKSYFTVSKSRGLKLYYLDQWSSSAAPYDVSSVKTNMLDCCAEARGYDIDGTGDYLVKSSVGAAFWAKTLRVHSYIEWVGNTSNGLKISTSSTFDWLL